MAGRKKGGSSVAPENRKTGRQISMNEAEWKKLDEEAEKLSLSRSALVRIALRKFYEKNEN